MGWPLRAEGILVVPEQPFTGGIGDRREDMLAEAGAIVLGGHVGRLARHLHHIVEHPRLADPEPTEENSAVSRERVADLLPVTGEPYPQIAAGGYQERRWR